MKHFLLYLKLFRLWNNHNQVICLDASHFIVIYEDFNDNYDGTAIIGTVTDTDVIEYGTEYDFHSSGRCMSLAATKLDASHFVATYRNSTTFGGATVITVSPTYVISSGTEKVFNDASTEHISVTSLQMTDSIRIFTAVDIISMTFIIPTNLYTIAISNYFNVNILWR